MKVATIIALSLIAMTAVPGVLAGHEETVHTVDAGDAGTYYITVHDEWTGSGMDPGIRQETNGCEGMQAHDNEGDCEAEADAIIF